MMPNKYLIILALTNLLNKFKTFPLLESLSSKVTDFVIQFEYWTIIEKVLKLTYMKQAWVCIGWEVDTGLYGLIRVEMGWNGFTWVDTGWYGLIRVDTGWYGLY